MGAGRRIEGNLILECSRLSIGEQVGADLRCRTARRLNEVPACLGSGIGQPVLNDDAKNCH